MTTASSPHHRGTSAPLPPPHHVRTRLPRGKERRQQQYRQGEGLLAGPTKWMPRARNTGGEGLQVHSFKRAKRLVGVKLRPIDEAMYRVRHIGGRAEGGHGGGQSTSETFRLPLYVSLISSLLPPYVRTHVRTICTAAFPEARQGVSASTRISCPSWRTPACTHHSLTSVPPQPAPKGERVIGRW